MAILLGMGFVEHIYVRHAGHGALGILVRGAVAGACLLPPTVLMGATLPAIARWVKTDPEGVSWLGFFYGGNIAGAVFGCLLAGFYLLARLRHGDGHLRRPGHQRNRGCDRPGDGGRFGPVRGAGHAGDRWTL